MRILITLVVCALFVSGCATDQVSFERMTEEELRAYNSDRPVHEQVYCYDRMQTGSRITRRFCDSVIDIVTETVRNAERVRVSQPSN